MLKLVFLKNKPMDVNPKIMAKNLKKLKHQLFLTKKCKKQKNKKSIGMFVKIF